ncbi:ABC transporter substrate-binding protein [Tomitella fengzijianii]|uniref:ABC transporter substrate-binding protein n=1 Tax=Tomitella fengzijianii TaxID=2597660 RepID=A0A516X5T1_9ACTN|nr:ABC transporter substrate-binding protein [Tomitella fengzijianii]QDQ98427.1 ABC transporter substrate-binding protein [Tomitella fengzijianii]
MRTTRGLLIAATASALLLAGCSSAGTTDSARDISEVTAGLIDDSDSAEGVQGGTISYAPFSGVSTLDPVRQDGGSTGGSQMAAIYDLLVRYDSASDEYVPQLAAGLEPNDDASVWTLALRDGVTFSDGAPVDAESVRWSVERYLTNRGTHAQLWSSAVERIDVVDPLTARIVLTKPWPQFPALLAAGPGMIVAPSSMATGTFRPIGAGPFTVADFQPGTALTLAARDDYWGGAPPLDTLRFPVITSEDGRLDALRNGDIDAAYMRSPDVVADALNTEDAGYLYNANMGAVLAVNQRPGRAAADPLVRRAIVAAVDPDLFDDRANKGKGMPESAMFGQWSRWGPTETAGYDPNLARQLLADAKAGGYDGTLTYVGLNAAYAQSHALAIQSMLEAVGFTVELDFKPSMADLIAALYAKHDFDIGESGFNVADEAPYVRLFSNLHSGSSSNVLGVESPEADRLLDRLQTADGDEARQSALDELQSWVNAEAPFAALGATKNLVAWRGVTDVVPSADGIMLFGDAARTEG